MRIAPYGAWKSPITTDLIIGEAVGLSELCVDGGDICWVEGRPAEKGRSVIVKASADGVIRDLLPPPFSSRSRVHEYGGASYVAAGGTVWFVNFADQRIWRLDAGAEPVPVTVGDAGWRFADLVLDAPRGRLIAVGELHGESGNGEPLNVLVSVPARPPEPAIPETIATGADFYGAPRLSPDGGRLAWIEWNHPNMPWDGTRLMVADVLDDGTLAEPLGVDGGDDVAVVQPSWSPAGTLHYVSDRSGWWNLVRWNGTGSGADAGVPLLPMTAEFARPYWNFGQATYGFTGDLIAAAFTRNGFWSLATGIGGGPTPAAAEIPYDQIGTVRPMAGGGIALLAGSGREPGSVALLTSEGARVLRRSAPIDLPDGTISVARPIEFQSAGGRTAYAFHYPPTNADHRAPEGTLPPLLVKSHGGPTSAASPQLNLSIQYWTSRGFAVVDVNYAGSSGFGTPYRRALDGAWGVADVEDCVAAATYLVDQGLADPERIAITGGSAGGYTTLCALTFTDRFRAGASHYGISDLEALYHDTHKFESRYLDRLIGPLETSGAIIEARSPIHHLDQIDCPVILFQGLDDKVVPPNQAAMMADALRAKGLPVALLTFEGEGHGFRQGSTIRRTLEAELWFYGRIFGFEPADAIDPVEIENWPDRHGGTTE